MNWKRLLTHLFVLTVALFAFLSLTHQERVGVIYGSFDRIQDAAGAFAIALGIVGGDELKRSGHRKVTPVLLGCGFAWFLVCSFLIYISKRPLRWSIVEALFIGMMLLIASQLPLALYLNRRQNKSTSQTTTDNAS
jgi:hypothetical protein